MVTGDQVDLNWTISPSSRKIPAYITRNSAQPCQMESCGEIMWIRVRSIADDDHDDIALYLDRSLDAFERWKHKYKLCRGIAVKQADSQHRGCQFDSSMRHF